MASPRGELRCEQPHADRVSRWGAAGARGARLGQYWKYPAVDRRPEWSERGVLAREARRPAAVERRADRGRDRSELPDRAEWESIRACGELAFQRGHREHGIR